jgi:nucleotide-binding universal stress UspA family protein
MKNLLCPIELNSNDQHLVAYAEQLGSLLQAHVYFLHVMQPQLDAAGAALMGIPMPLDNTNDATTRAIEFEAALASRPNLQSSLTLTSGILQEEIMRMAEEINADLVLMGSQHQKQKLGMWFENHAVDFISKRKFPLLSVPIHFDETAARSNEIVFATDFDRINEWDVLDIFTEIAQSWKSKVNVFTVRSSKVDSEIALNEKDMFERFQSYFSPLTTELHHAYAANEIMDAIEKFAERKKAKLIVMVSHDLGFLGRLFHKSISQQMVVYSKIPLLIIPDKKLEENAIGVTNSWSNL